MSYCDYLAHLIRMNLVTVDRLNEALVDKVGQVEFDIDANGTFRSTKKTLEVTDVTGRKYTITVEEK